MHTTIGQISYPNRQAFFEKLALNLPAQPAIKIGPAPLPSGERLGSWNMRKAVADGDVEHGTTGHGAERTLS